MRSSTSFVYLLCVAIGILTLSMFYTLTVVWVEQLQNLPRENFISYIFTVWGALLLIGMFVSNVVSFLFMSFILVIIGFVVTLIAGTRLLLAKIVIAIELSLLFISVFMAINLMAQGGAGTGFAMLPIFGFWIASIASSTTLLTTTIIKSFPLKLVPIIAMCSMLLILVPITLINQPNDTALEKSKEVKSKILKIYADPEFPIYEPSYFPNGVGGLKTESVYENEDGDTVYLRSYQYKLDLIDPFIIRQTKSKAPITAKDNLEGLRIEAEKQKSENSTNRNKVDYKVLTINNQPAMLYMLERKNGDIDRMLYIFYDNMWMEAAVSDQILGFYGDLTEEDLIRMAESLQRIN